MKSRRIIVFSTYPGDEVIGCGGTIALVKANGAKVKVVVITDGERGILENFPQIRREECIIGLEILGIEDVIFLGYSVQRIPLSGAIIENYRKIVSEFRPHYILLPSPMDIDPNKRRVTRGVIKALEGRWKAQLLFYETIQPVLVNTTNDITSVIELKRLALQAHISQIEQFNYEDLCLSLARLRGLSVNQKYAEGFLTYNWDGSKQNFFETRPLISVIVRADNILHLRNALKCLISQSYDQLEVILVWHGTEKIDLTEFEYLDLQFIEGSELNAINLNIGLSYARGEYIAFLDQDDIIYPNHMELLVSQLHGNNEYDIVYSNCKVLHCEMKDGEPLILREEDLFNHHYQPGRLLIGNYIPIHALLFRSYVFRCHKFDESLMAYEDWEMLARLEISGYRFLHVDSITCEYRLFGQGDLTLKQLHESKGYLSHNKEVLLKIVEKFRVNNLEQLSRLILTNEAKIRDLEKLLTEQEEQLAEKEKELSEYKSINTLLSKGISAAKIKHHGRDAVAAMIGHLISDETLFSIVLPVYNTPADILEETLLSVRNQIFTGWELCLVDDASDNEDTRNLLLSIEKSEYFKSRLKYLRRKERGGIVKALNDAVGLAQAPYLVFLDHDDLLHGEALLELAMIIKTEKMYSLLYTDSCTIDLTGKLLHIFHKPDWSPENLIHSNYINHLTVVRRDIFNQVGGFRQKYEGAQDLDLLLRLSLILTDNDIRHINVPLYSWRATSDSVAYSSFAKPYIFDSACRVITEHLSNKGLEDVSVESNPYGIGFCCKWKTRNDEIEIIIPTKDNLLGLKMCIEGLFQMTDYPCFSLTIVSNNSSTDMLNYLQSLRGKERIRIIIDNRPFNWSALNNRVIAESSAPLILFLNDDVEIKDRNWLLNMSKYLMLDGVGAVGATLFYPDGTLQHNGIITDEKFVARNITTWGKKKELTTTRNVSAVTGACLLVKRKTLESVGGLNEELPRSYNDVDLCLNIRSKGLRIVQAVDVQLIHHESETYGELDNLEKKKEWEHSSELMRNKWGKKLKEKYLASYDIFAQYTKIVKIGR